MKSIYHTAVDTAAHALYNNSMNWDYRVIQHTDRYSIHEVYYGDQGEAAGYNPDPAWPVGSTVEELSHSLIHQMGALTRPIIPSDQLQRRKQRDQVVQTTLNLLGKKSDV